MRRRNDETRCSSLGFVSEGPNAPEAVEPTLSAFHHPEGVRKLAVDMYTEGSNLEVIGRVQGVKPGTVYSWVKKVRWA